jgi:hypothetical protein
MATAHGSLSTSNDRLEKTLALPTELNEVSIFRGLRYGGDAMEALSDLFPLGEIRAFGRVHPIATLSADWRDHVA